MFKRFIAVLCACCIAAGLLVSCSKEPLEVLSVVDEDQGRMIRLSGEKTKPANFYDADFLVLGGGLGGIAAALSICSSGRTVVLVEESDRIAGCFDQPDTTLFSDNSLIESSGASRSYQEFRKGIREWYKEKKEQPPELFSELFSGIAEFESDQFCFETEAALKVINDMMASNIKRGKLTVIKRHKIAKVVTFSSRIASLHAIDMDNLVVSQFTGWMIVDATRSGYLMPIAGIDFNHGRESSRDTGEKLAPVSIGSHEPLRYLHCTPPDDDSGVAVCDISESSQPSTEFMVEIPVYRYPRRMKGFYRISEQDILKSYHEGPRGKFFRDSVGIGFYPVMLDEPDGGRHVAETVPFQVPLSALIPERFANYIAGGRILSSTFVASKAYMSPSVEWTIGEAAGEAAAYCAGYKINTHDLLQTPEHVRGLQDWLVTKRGVPIYWYDDVTPSDPDFAEAQLRPFDESGYNEAQTTLHYHKEKQ